MEYKLNLKDFDLSKIKDFNQTKIIESDNFVTVTRACRDAMDSSIMMAIIGEPGYGKTSALQHFASITTNVFIITVKKCMTAKVFYTNLLEQIGYKNRHKANNIYHIIESIGYYLSQIPGKKLLIIDEAGKLSNQELLYLHDLWDTISSHTGIILAGPNYFQGEIEKMSQQGVVGIPELFRRITLWMELGTPTFEEKKALFYEYGVLNLKLLNSLARRIDIRTLSQAYNWIRSTGIKIKRILDQKDPNDNKHDGDKSDD